jgi:predicted ArsR family transcriptional regulator
VGTLRVLVAATEPMAIAEAAERLACHPNSARSHLDALVADGLATRTTVASGGRGRPHYRYAAVAGADAALAAVESSDLVTDEYRGLVAAFATVLRTGGAGVTTATAREVGHAWARALPLSAGRGTPRRRLVDLLDRLGFSPTPGRSPNDRAEDGRALVELRTCPLLDVAAEFPDVICQVHLGLIESAHRRAGGSAEGVELVPFAAPGACHVLVPRDPSDRGS